MINNNEIIIDRVLTGTINSGEHKTIIVEVGPHNESEAARPQITGGFFTSTNQQPANDTNTF